MINLITGKAASGKTVTIYDILATKSTENNIIITNPQSIEAYEKFLANNHIAATVLSINDAPASLSSILGYTYKTVASTIDKIAIISDIIRNAENLSIIKPNNVNFLVIFKSGITLFPSGSKVNTAILFTSIVYSSLSITTLKGLFACPIVKP